MFSISLTHGLYSGPPPGPGVGPAGTTVATGIERRIEATTGWRALQLRELVEHRELLFFFAWRDVKVRYKQTALGAAWALLQPFLTMVVFSVFFGKLAKVPSDGIPYPIFSFAALVPWTFFASGLTNASNALVGSATLLKKVYFPRLAVPIATVLVGLVDLAIALGLLFAMMAYYGVRPTLAVTTLPALVVLALAAALGVGLWLSAMNVRYRDVRYVVPFLTQIWMFATPVAYPSSLVRGPWRSLYAVNPMVGVVDGFRWALFGSGRGAPVATLAVSSVSAALLLVSGAFYFRRMERTFADAV